MVSRRFDLLLETSFSTASRKTQKAEKVYHGEFADSTRPSKQFGLPTSLPIGHNFGKLLGTRFSIMR